MTISEDILGALTTELANVRVWRDPVNWLEAHLTFPDGSPFPGAFTRETLPPMAAIIKAMGPTCPSRQVTVRACAQFGKTSLALAVLAMRAETRPGHFLIVIPASGPELTAYAAQKVDPIFQGCKGVATLLGNVAHDGKGVDQMATRTFPGGSYQICAAAGANTFRGSTTAVVILDDVDACKKHREGDLIHLARGRLATMRHRGAKLIVISSPGDHPSLVDQQYLAGSQSECWLPCMKCGGFQVMLPERMVWKVPADVHYKCAHCGRKIRQYELTEMLPLHEWRPRNRDQAGVHESFAYSQLMLPPGFVMWEEYAEAKLDAFHELRENHDENPLRVVVNVRDGLAYETRAQRRLKGLAKQLYANREPSWDVAGLPLVARTAGVDLNSTWLESSIYGWGAGREHWVLDHDKHPCVGRETIDSSDLWDRWATWVIERGVQAVCVDGSYSATTVRDQITRLLPMFLEHGILLYAIKGSATLRSATFWPAAVAPGQVTASGPHEGELQLVPVYVPYGKAYFVGAGADLDGDVAGLGSLVAAATRTVLDSGANVAHVSTERDRAWCAQIFAERIVDGKWKKPVSTARNEALDCAVYSLAALFGLCSFHPEIAVGVLGRVRGDTPPTPTIAPRPAPPRTSGRPEAAGIW